MEKESRSFFRNGPSWRQVYMAMFVSLLGASALLYVELRHGVGIGSNIVELNSRGLAIAESTRQSTVLARRAIARQDTTQALIVHSQRVILAELRRLATAMEKNQNRQLAKIQRDVSHVEAKVDSVQRVIPQQKKK